MQRIEQRILEIAGANLAAERARRRMTQEDVARIAGIHTTQVARMERGVNDSGITKYVLLSWAIGIPPTDLFAGLDEP